MIAEYYRRYKLWRRRRYFKPIREALRILRTTDNTGLKRRALVNMPGVTGVHHTRGWSTYVDVRMSDGWETTTRSDITNGWNPLRAAGIEVALRLRDKYNDIN